MRAIVLLICLILMVPIEAGSCTGYGITEGDSFEYYFEFNHVHIWDKVEIYDYFDLRELDFSLNDSIALTNGSYFEVEVGTYTGPTQTRPFSIPGKLSNENETVGVSDIPWMILHNVEWDNYWSTLTLIFNQSAVPGSETFVPYETNMEIGFDLEWRVQDHPRDELYIHSVRYDKRTGIASYFKLDMVNNSTDSQGNDYISYTKVIFIKTNENLTTRSEFKISINQYSGITFLLIFSSMNLRKKYIRSRVTSAF